MATITKDIPSHICEYPKTRKFSLCRSLRNKLHKQTTDPVSSTKVSLSRYFYNEFVTSSLAYFSSKKNLIIGANDKKSERKHWNACVREARRVIGDDFLSDPLADLPGYVAGICASISFIHPFIS